MEGKYREDRKTKVAIDTIRQNTQPTREKGKKKTSKIDLTVQQ